MSHFHQGKYRPKNPSKYVNKKNLNDIVYRSSWEKVVMIWCDQNSDIVKWGSEEVVIPYISKADGRKHRYFIDFYLKFKSGKVLLIEVKPEYQTKAPDIKSDTKKSKATLLRETTTYAVNMSKWEAARDFAIANNAEFQVWTEKHLEKMGLQVKTTKTFRAKKYGKKTWSKGYGKKK